VRSACRSDSACQDVACAIKLTVVDHLRAQHQALAALLRPLRIYIRSDGVYAVVGQRVAARGELLAASRDILGAEDAGRRREDGLLEEAAVQHLHGAVRRRGEHVVRGHWRFGSDVGLLGWSRGELFLVSHGNDAVLGGQVAGGRCVALDLSRVNTKHQTSKLQAYFYTLTPPPRCHCRRVRVSTRRSTGVSLLHDRGK
jgi:hypothetical protein